MIKKIITNLLALAIIVLTAIIASKNSDIVTRMYLLTDSKVQITICMIVLLSALSGLIAGIIFMLQFILQKNTAVKAYERQLEKTSVSSDESSAKVKVLEAKILTLEKALEEATKKNQ